MCAPDHKIHPFLGDSFLNLFTRLSLHFICKKNSKRLSFTSWISILGVAFGVAAFLVTVTILNSFQYEMKRLISATNPNLIVFSPSGIPDVLDYENQLKSMIEVPVERMSPFVYQESVLGLGRQTSSVYIRAITGSSSASAEQLTHFITPQNAIKSLDQSSTLIDGNRNTLDFGNTPEKLPHVVLGADLAEHLNAKKGNIVTLMSFANEENNLKIRYNKLFVTGIIDVGISQYNKQYVLMNFDDGIQLFGIPNWASGIEIKLKDPDQAFGVSEKLNKQIPYHTVSWEQVDSKLFSQIKRDSASIKLIVLIISFVAGFNIIVTLTLTIMDRTKQISLLRSLGAQKKFITGVFVLSGTFLGFLGSVLGICSGIGLLQIIAGIPLGDFRKFYYLEKIPVHMDFQLISIAFLTAILLSFFGALYPAWRAARISPISGLRD